MRGREAGPPGRGHACPGSDVAPRLGRDTLRIRVGSGGGAARDLGRPDTLDIFFAEAIVNSSRLLPIDPIVPAPDGIPVGAVVRSPDGIPAGAMVRAPSFRPAHAIVRRAPRAADVHRVAVPLWPLSAPCSTASVAPGDACCGADAVRSGRIGTALRGLRRGRPANLPTPGQQQEDQNDSEAPPSGALTWGSHPADYRRDGFPRLEIAVRQKGVRAIVPPESLSRLVFVLAMRLRLWLPRVSVTGRLAGFAGALAPAG